VNAPGGIWKLHQAPDCACRSPSVQVHGRRRGASRGLPRPARGAHSCGSRGMGRHGKRRCPAPTSCRSASPPRSPSRASA